MYRILKEIQSVQWETEGFEDSKEGELREVSREIQSGPFTIHENNRKNETH